MDGAAEMGNAPGRARLPCKIKTLGHVKIEMSTRNPSGVVKGRVGSLSGGQEHEQSETQF